MSGKTAVITGATGGIGFEIARGLARLGADVVIGARDIGRGEDARRIIAADNAAVRVMALDVADLASVRRFSADFHERFGPLHVLVNNAGAWFTERRTSADGFELTFATNTLGPFALTELLIDRLRAAGTARREPRVRDLRRLRRDRPAVHATSL